MLEGCCFVVVPESYQRGELPGLVSSGWVTERMPHQEALVVALARAHRWQTLLDEGKFKSVSDLAAISRSMSWSEMSNRILEAILAGDHPPKNRCI